MDSNPRFQLQQQQQHQPNSGLLRFRSAPSSVLLSGAAYKDIPPTDKTPNESSSSISSLSSSPPLTRMNSQQGYSTGVPSRFMRQNSTASSAIDSSYDHVGSIAMEHHQTNTKSFGSDLLRQNSFPAGNFNNNNISFQNAGYDTMKGVGNYGGMDGSDSELSLSMNRLKNQISFSPGSPSSLGMLSQISKLANEGIGATSPDDGRQGDSNGDARYYGPGFPYDSWNETSHLSENLSGFKRERDSNDKLYSDAQNGELGNQVHMLSHHLSLPKSSSEVFGMENLLQFPDSVPCKIRAKRGYATHPRSIAERVRRTRISERIRKLQELVPNMDKQTSTADMLDFAVDYIKDLQKQFKSLSDKRAKCKCISMQKSDTNQS